jgi:hypothetical protein
MREKIEPRGQSATNCLFTSLRPSYSTGVPALQPPDED